MTRNSTDWNAEIKIQWRRSQAAGKKKKNEDNV